MDIWEANKVSQAVTAHPCSMEGQKRCEGEDCGPVSVCDKAGCDFGSYRVGVPKFFGPGADYTIDSTKPITVVT